MNIYMVVCGCGLLFFMVSLILACSLCVAARYDDAERVVTGDDKWNAKMDALKDGE